jgi:hypothetical protein
MIRKNTKRFSLATTAEIMLKQESMVFSSEVDTGSRKEARQNSNLKPGSDVIRAGKALNERQYTDATRADRR